MKCSICGSEVVLVPTAAERAKRYGGTAQSYTARFPTHSDCLIAKREADTRRLMAEAKYLRSLPKAQRKGALELLRISSHGKEARTL